MKLKKKIVFVSMFIITLILFLNTSSYAGTQRWNSLDYDVTLNDDGSMDVIETWNIYVSETNTLFKTFDISIYDKYKMNNVKISEIKNGKEEFLNRINTQQYHVDPGCYYGLQIDNSKYEIAWNVGLDNSSDTRLYKMYYTVENAVTIYKDCTELYWQFLSNKNGIFGNNITGTIKLPNPVSNIEKLRIWGHGPLGAKINKKSNQEVFFSLNYINSNKMLEVRVVTEENIYKNASNYSYTSKLDNILKEEQKWADEANEEREYAKDWIASLIAKFIVCIIINIIGFIVFLKINKKYKMVGLELKEKYSYDPIEIQYFRDIPDEENATPARGAYYYYFNSNDNIINLHMSKIFSATILDLSIKELIRFNTDDKKNIEIYLIPDNQNKCMDLSEDELIVFNILKDAMGVKKCITIKEFEKYTSKNYENVYKELNKIKNVVEKDFEQLKKILLERKNINKKWKSKYVLFFFITFFSFFIQITFLPAVTIGLFLITRTCYKNSSYISIFSNQGNEEEKQGKGLKRCMEEYSLLKDK